MAPRENFLAHYGGTRVRHLADANEIDWAALFPIPEKRRRASDDEDGEAGEGDSEDYMEDCEEEFNISPRLAYTFYSAGLIHLDMQEDDSEFGPRLPPIAEAYWRNPTWRKAYCEAVRRLLSRVAKGQEPHPNCTGEEIAFHNIIETLEDPDTMDAIVEDPVYEALPRSSIDDDLSMFSEACVQDQDVLMLYDSKAGMADAVVGASLGLPSPLGMADFANLHPKDWYKPFKPHLVNDHV